MNFRTCDPRGRSVIHDEVQKLGVISADERGQIFIGKAVKCNDGIRAYVMLNTCGQVICHWSKCGGGVVTHVVGSRQ